jgi:hypothetical protein
MIEDLFNDWQIIGLTLNIVGVYFILNSLIFKKPRRFLNDYYGIEKRRPLREIRENVLSQVQLVVGFVFLIFGFFLQISYQLSLRVEERGSFFQDPSVLTIAATLIGSMLLVMIVLKGFQIYWTKRTFRRLLIDFFRENPWALEQYPATAKEVGLILGVTAAKDDSVAEYLDRLRKFLEIDGDTKKNDDARDKSVARPRSAIRQEPISSAPHPATPPRIGT